MRRGVDDSDDGRAIRWEAMVGRGEEKAEATGQGEMKNDMWPCLFKLFQLLTTRSCCGLLNAQRFSPLL